MKNITRTISPLQHAVIETLDSRRMLSATLADTGMLSIVGTRRHDRINIALDANDAQKLNVRVNRESYQFNLSGITSGVSISSGRGNDRINIAETNGAITLDFTINAGAGKDRIITASGDDSINAGAGNDRVWAGNGDDVVNGRQGRDVLSGGEGEDQIDGGAGKDDLLGGDDDDVLIGGAGNDRIDGEDGDDCAFGGRGDDKLDGGEGDDDLYGGVDDDTLAGDNGDDLIDGDTGDDELQGGDGSDVFNDDEDEALDHDTNDDNVTRIAFDALNDTIKQAFIGAFGNVNVLCVRVSQGEDGTLYQIDYMLESSVHEVILDATGTLVQHEVHGGEDPVQFAQLPQSVRDAFNQAFPSVRIGRIEVEDVDDTFVYTLWFRNEGFSSSVQYDAQGAQLNYESDLPDGSPDVSDD